MAASSCSADEMSDAFPFDGSDLRALFINCTLTPSPGESHTQRLMDRSMALMRRAGVQVEGIRAVDHDIATGVQPDMREHGASSDEWPALMERVLAADILVLGTPIWLGDPSSVCRRVVERLYSWAGELNDHGQSVFYGRVGGVVVTGNEDGVKHCGMNLIYSLQHVGYTIPPQADSGWVGEIGPGPSYGDDGVGLDHDFTNRNTTIMTWNLMHLAQMLHRDGIASFGNDRNAWADGERFGWE